MLPVRRLETVHVVRTPEYVEFDYPLAGMTSRFLAWLLDNLLIAAVTMAGVIAFSFLAIATGGLAMALLFVWVFLVQWGYYVFFEWFTAGQTPGKKALGLRVLQDTGVRLSFYQSALRNLLRPFDHLPIFYLVGGVSALFTHDHKRLGDLAAGTIVVRDQRRKVPAEIARPRGEAGWDRKWYDRVRRASVEERELFLSACLRREELAQPARLQLFPELSRYAQTRFGIEKPPHLSDEKFVVELTAAVLADERPRANKASPSRAQAA